MALWNTTDRFIISRATPATYTYGGGAPLNSFEASQLEPTPEATAIINAELDEERIALTCGGLESILTINRNTS
jgi:hypothetical protein